METKQPAKTPRLLSVAPCLGMEAARKCWGPGRRKRKRRTTTDIQEEISVGRNGISYNEKLYVPTCYSQPREKRLYRCFSVSLDISSTITACHL